MPPESLECGLSAAPSVALDAAVAEQRGLLLAAAATQFADLGFHAATVDDIAAAATLEMADFQCCFESKEACFLVLFDELAGEAVGRVGGAYLCGTGDWPQRLTAALVALFALAGEQPNAVRACLAEALTVGPAATERLEQARRSFGTLLREGRSMRSGGEELSATLEETLAGGVLWMIERALASQGPPSLDPLLPEALRFLLAPYLGNEGARRTAGRLL